MKHMRKVFALALTLIMALALTVPAFAEEATSGSITVDNPVAGQTYTAYKIFDVSYDASKTAYSYTISGTSDWFSVVAKTAADGTVSSKIDGLTLTKAYSEDTYVVSVNANFSAPEFANTLKSNVTGKTGTPLAAGRTGVSVEGLDLGYYFVMSTTGALCNLTTTNPEVTIHDKNDVPFEKEADDVNVEVGQTVNYTITGKVPDATGFTTYDYTIKDTMTSGLTFKNDVTVKLMNGDTVVKALAAGTDYTYTAETNGFELTIKVLDLQAYVGKTIKVTYSAVVNENAIASVQKNKATLTYSNDPTNSTKTATTPAEEKETYSTKIVIDKFKDGEEETKLAGAKFVLFKNVTEVDKETGKETTSKLYYKYTAATETESAKVEWVDDIANATSVTTDVNGAAEFGGLAEGTYYLEETEAPDGYNLLAEPVAVTVSNESSKEAAELSITAEVANSTGSLLPATGGIGTTIFYMVGGILMAGAAILLITKKKMSNEQ